MDRQETISILVLSNQAHVINPILAGMRDEKQNLIAQLINSTMQLQDKTRHQHWDLVLCSDDSAVSPGDIAAALQSEGRDLPIIYLYDDNSPTNTDGLIQTGINDYLELTQTEKIRAAIKREVKLQRLSHNYR